MDKDNAQIIADEMSVEHKLFGKAITYKLLVVVFFVSIFVLLIGMFGAEALQRSWKASQDFAKTDVPVISNLYTLEEVVSKQFYYLETLSSDEKLSQSSYEKIFTDFEIYSEVAYKALDETESLLKTNEEMSLLKNAKVEYQEFSENSLKYIKRFTGNESDLTVPLYQYLQKSNSARRTMQDHLFSLSHLIKDRIDQNAGALANTQERLRTNLFYLSILGLIIASIAGVMLGKKVVLAPAISAEHHVEELSSLNRELNSTNKLLVEREIQLNDANKRLRELDKVRSEFVSIVAHQLRTPLAGIKWTLDMLINGDMGELTIDQKSHLMKVLDTNERTIRFVTDLLSVSRIESGRLEYTFTPVNLRQVAESVLLDISPISNKRGVTVNFRAKGLTLPSVAADTEKIRAVFQNLIENAVKYTSKGGSVSIDIRNKGKEIQVAVSDNGPGIPKDEQKNVFKQFYRAPSAIKMHVEGSGLGLYLAKAIVEGHGGKIWFESDMGKGTTFYFTIPIPRKMS